MSDRPNGEYYVVWEDVIEFKDLRKAVVISLVLGVLCFLVARQVFIVSGRFQPGIGKGYTLLVALVVLVVIGGILSKAIKPKRIFEEKEMKGTLADPEIYQFLDMNIEEEKEFILKNLDKIPEDVLEEMKKVFGPDSEGWVK